MDKKPLWLHSSNQPVADALSIGGLFGSPDPKTGEVLDWDGAQQVAYIMYLGKLLQDAVANTSAEWAEVIRKDSRQFAYL